jgi:CHAT domain-containing protein/tetratricopeptide (TPR) repeat protein
MKTLTKWLRQPIEWLIKQFAPAQGNQNNDIPPLFRADFNQANAAEARYQFEGGGVQALDEAIAAWERILNHAEFDRVDEEFRLVVLNDSAITYIYHYQTIGTLTDLDRALSFWEETVKLTPDNSPELLIPLNNLGLGLKNRYARLGEFNDLQEAIQNYQKAVELTPNNSPELLIPLNNLGNALIERYAHLDEFNDLQEAIQSFWKTVELAPDNSPELPKYLNNLGIGLSNRYARLGELNDLQDAIQNYQKAVELTPNNSPELPSPLNNLGLGLRNRYTRLGEFNDLQEALQNYQKAIELSPDNSPELPKYLNNLGNGLSDHYDRLGDLNDLQEATQNYRRSAERGLEVALKGGVRNACNWLNWAFDRKEWQEVIEAYQYAYQAGNQLVRTQLTREHQSAFLKDSQGLAAHAAYAFAKTNQLEKAIVTLERGLAQLLSEALARDRADLEQLKALGHNDLYDRYQQAVNDWHLAQTARPEKVRTLLQTARQALNETITAIRQVAGYGEFLEPPVFADIVAAAKGSHLVYLAVTKAGGLALILFENKEIQEVWLPELTQATLEQILDSLEPPYSGYLRRYYDWRTHPKDENYRQQWLNSLDKTTNLLWEKVMAPLFKALPKSATITLIPVGLLGFLPLHAAWRQEGDVKRYALDDLTIGYAPNARTLKAARQMAEQVNPDHFLAIEEPKPVKANDLPSTQYETAMVIFAFKSLQKGKNYDILKNESATHQAVSTALPKYNMVHFSCHGIANFEEPLKSALIMANDEPLTIENWQRDLRLNGIRLASLSACETGILGTTLPEEVVSLPTGLLEAGVAGVVASLWSVNDFSTALLMGKFYDNLVEIWKTQGTQAAIAPALIAAQRWLRDAHQRELLAWVNQLDLDEETLHLVGNELECYDDNDKPFSHAFYWAAFGAVGQ